MNMSENSKAQIADSLLRFIYDNFPLARHKSISLNDLLIEEHIIDSLGLLTVIMFIEEKFNIQVNDEDVGMKNFNSVEAISSYVTHCLSNKRDN